MSAISVMGPRDSFTHLVKPYLNQYFGERFESLCREALPLIYQKEGVNSSFEIGEFWNKEVQMDVVGYRKRDGVDIGECKWGQIRSQKRLIEELEKKIRKYPNQEGLTLTGRVFMKLALKNGKADSLIRFYSLKDLYLAGKPR